MPLLFLSTLSTSKEAESQQDECTRLGQDPGSNPDQLVLKAMLSTADGSKFTRYKA